MAELRDASEQGSQAQLPLGSEFASTGAGDAASQGDYDYGSDDSGDEGEYEHGGKGGEDSIYDFDEGDIAGGAGDGSTKDGAGGANGEGGDQ